MLIYIALIIVAILAYRRKRWRGVAYVIIGCLVLILLATFSLFMLGTQVSSILNQTP